MTIKGVIFDSDGTLVDSERLAASLLRDLLAERDIHLPHDEVLRRFRGVQFAIFVGELCEEHGHLDAEPFMRDFRSRSLDLFAAGLDAMPGALDFVRELKLPKCVASNGPRTKIETCLKTAGLWDAFDGNIVSAYEVNAWKPSPELIVAAARMLMLEPGECLLVDDSIPGVQAGLAAGSKVAGYGDTDFSRFEGQPGFHHVPDYTALKALLASLA
ncbi:putative phosphatase YieH [Pseudomonas sp. M47T1]|uniref:HAD family hydrolase n=1 Tax=unclassified Pseudomonas TaxID=196821 RepID=UPI0002607254|nr:HAD-IA family hydrolase [Pseudomonas sp. M47T1]EIK96629.1 putative phosphatase YieH [Pseudomonas sp. M47T1]